MRRSRIAIPLWLALTLLAAAGPAWATRVAAGEPTLQTVAGTSTEHLFFEGYTYYLNASLPEDEQAAAAAAPLAVSGFSASIKTGADWPVLKIPPAK